MNNELTVRINSKNHKAFLQDGFYSHTIHSVKLHKHNHAEIHVVAKSKTPFIVNGQTHFLEDGSLVVVPSETAHCFKDPNIEHKSAGFQVDYPFSQFLVKKIPNEMADEFLTAIDKANLSGDYLTVASYISLFCGYFLEKSNVGVTPITDYGFLIEEFFSNRYSEDVHLEDLAETLHLSPRQTERLVIRYTGKSFRQELMEIRLGTATHLLNTTSMSPVKIADYVGYQSYTGFYKAMKKAQK